MSLPEPPPVPKFKLGDCFIPSNTLDVLTYEEIVQALRRHQGGDWGDVDEYDRLSNEEALKYDLRLHSVYHTTWGAKFYVTTEQDRSMTTILVPENEAI